MAPELELFIQEEVSSGRFPSREAFINYAVRLVQMEREDALAGIRAGLADAAAGRMKSVDEAFDDILRSTQLANVKSRY